MQQKTRINDEIEMNPIFAYRNRLSINYKAPQQTPKEFANRIKSLEKKEFHPPTFRNSKTNLALQAANSVVKRKGTDTTITTISDISTFTNRQTKDFESNDNIQTEVFNQNFSTINNTSLNNSNVFVKKRISRSPVVTHVKNYQKPKEYTINLEDLMLIEQKLYDIILCIDNQTLVNNSCFEWWNFFFNCSLNENLEYYFINTDLKEIVQFCTNVQFLSIMMIYDLSYDVQSFQILYLNIKNLILLLHKSFLVICDYISSRIKKEFSKFIWVDKLRQLLRNKDGYKVSEIHKDDIKFNGNCAYEYIRLILTNYNNHEKTMTFKKLFENIKIQTANDFNQIFLNKVLRVANPKGSVVASFLINSREKMSNVKAPYIKTKPLKDYTLVLDLDETLMSFKMSEKDETQGLMRLRPGLYDFLDSVSQFYELIVFTAATQDYADPILNAIEDGKPYFSYRFYREHTVIVQNDFVKDITRIGRDVSKTIIVDNMPQNFRLQKENGILILSFLGEDQDDIALLELEKILIQIAKENGDVRVSLKKYKDEITKNVSSKIYQN